MLNSNEREYDVVIMGAGFAGVCQARHLKLNIPGIKVAVVDPRSEERGDKDLKIGESMVEIAALFVCKELGLHDYMIENQTPKAGLNFHWPKDPAKTKSLDDYYHVWANRQTHISSFHMNRATFERDVLKMNKEMGVDHLQGHVVDLDLTPADEIHTVHVKTENGPLTLKAKHVVDAAGRRFLIGKKTDNLLMGPDNLHNVDNGSAWVRVRNVDRTLFFDGFDPNGGSSVSRYYATNHWFGHGHWLWMIPTCRDTMELSIGVVYHKSVIPSQDLDSDEKFRSFLKENHSLLHQLVESGDQVDFISWPRIAHRSKQMFSPDNWYVIGDAAYVLDAFYSYGTTTIALAIEGVTEIVRGKLQGDADVETKREAYNRFNLTYAKGVNLLIREHDKQLGHASLMSWRIYFEYMWWFGVHVPMYVGKWHLCPNFASRFADILNTNASSFFPHVYKQINTLIERGTNLGIMDCYRGDQLWGDYTTLHHFDDFLENSKLEAKRANVFVGMSKGYRYILLWYLMFLKRGFGWKALLSPTNLKYCMRLLKLSARSAIGNVYFRWKSRKRPANSIVARMRNDFKHYKYASRLVHWDHHMKSRADNASRPAISHGNEMSSSEMSTPAISPEPVGVADFEPAAMDRMETDAATENKASMNTTTTRTTADILNAARGRSLPSSSQARMMDGLSNSKTEGSNPTAHDNGSDPSQKNGNGHVRNGNGNGKRSVTASSRSEAQPVADGQHQPLAVVGIGCWYPGARNPVQFWENILARRKQFRQMPDCRMPLSDYHAADRSVSDKTYARRAAVIDGFEFDWANRRIPKQTYNSTDVAHWLALEVAISALQDAGYDRNDVPRDKTAVIVGNSLTGEQARSNTMRLRWPFVERALVSAAHKHDVPHDVLGPVVDTMQHYYKSVFAAINEDTLAGGLANTIAGRICNYFDLHGGGYNVDGACCSSLLAVCTAANHLVMGDADLAIAGGVDISLDPFELIGFSKTGALTETEMRVYDHRASGFIPGEGCGFVVLKRLADAQANADKIYAVVQGWGISSDGKGGITAPSVNGQAAAIRRAYDRAGYDSSTLDFVEGHGTGTPVGDKTELTALGKVIGESKNGSGRSCGVTSLKSIIGHTKAAAGIGAFIKATIAANRRVIPPTANCAQPSNVFQKDARSLHPVRHGAVEDPTKKIRAGVSAMGFGGINTHITLESAGPPDSKLDPSYDERGLLASAQETEVFVFSDSTTEGLARQLSAAAQIAADISDAEMVDYAKHLSGHLNNEASVRAAIVASAPAELAMSLDQAVEALQAGSVRNGQQWESPNGDVMIANGVHKTRLGFVFPGQGSQQLQMARTLIERYEWARQMLNDAEDWVINARGPAIASLVFRPHDTTIDEKQLDVWRQELSFTNVAQPTICLASMLYAKYLRMLGLEPTIVGGHSLGELTAFHAAGAIDDRTLLQLAAFRGQAMMSNKDQPGAMVALLCSREAAEGILQEVDGYAVVANYNSERQTVISGIEEAMSEAMEIANHQGISSFRLPVSNAFHSKLVQTAAQQMNVCNYLDNIMPLRIPVVSGMEGEVFDDQCDLREHLAKQITNPVDFAAVVTQLQSQTDLLIEVGPGKILSNLTQQIGGDDGVRCLPVASTPEADKDLNMVLATAYVQGVSVHWNQLYEGRLVRPFISASDRIFIENPCERPFQSADGETPVDVSRLKREIGNHHRTQASVPSEKAVNDNGLADTKGNHVEAMVLQLAADATGYPIDSMPLTSRLLDDLNLDSIKASEFVARAMQASNVKLDGDAGTLANATLGDIIDLLKQHGADRAAARNSGNPSDSSSPSMEVLLLDQVAKVTGYPKDSIPLDSRLLDDLNLDSIKAAELIASITKNLIIPTDFDPTRLANASLKEVAAVLEGFRMEERDAANSKTNPNATSKSVADQRWSDRQWVRNFVTDYVATPLGEHQPFDWSSASVRIVAEESEQEIAEKLAETFRDLGTLVQVNPQQESSPENKEEAVHWITILPRSGRSSATDVEAMVGRLHAVVQACSFGNPNETSSSVTVVQFGAAAQGGEARATNVAANCAISFCRSLHLERPNLRLRVVDLHRDVTALDAANLILKEIPGERPFVAATYDSNQIRSEQRMRLQQPAAYNNRPFTLESSNVVLVTGGAKGITAECARALGESKGVTLALAGSSVAPSADDTESEVAMTLQRLRSARIECHYYCCDITDAEQVTRLVQTVRSDLGPIQAVVHGAGANHPRPAAQVSITDAVGEVGPKLIGAINLLEALDDTPPKLFVSFTSIIGVTGMPGNAWYAFSNEAVEVLTREFECRHANTQTLSIAFSVWDEVGMGARMGSIDRLAQMGIGAIPVAEGTQRFVKLIESDPGESQVVVTARLASLETWHPAGSIVEGLPFIEQVDYVEPGVELQVRTELTLEKDPYVLDHVFNGSHLFPTVFGLEAMTQAAAYVLGNPDIETIRLEDIVLERPIVVPPDGGVQIGLLAEVGEINEHGEQSVRVHIRSERTQFATDHFAATLILGVRQPGERREFVISDPLDIRPQIDLYGDLLFQGDSFQRMENVYTLNSERCLLKSHAVGTEELTSSQIAGGRSRFLLQDPYFRDLLLQSIQLTIPQHICLPISIGRIDRYAAPEAGQRFVHVWLQRREDQEYIGEITATNEQGDVIERISDYRLRILKEKPDNPTAAELAAPDERDQGIVEQAVAEACEAFECSAPEIGCAQIPNLTDKQIQERRAHELPLVKDVVARIQLDPNDSADISFELDSEPSGKPVLVGDSVSDLQISLSHDDRYLLCTVDESEQGCDIEAIVSRPADVWHRMLGMANHQLLEELQRRGDSLDEAGTRIWSAIEAMRKIDNDADINLRIRKRRGTAVLLTSESLDAAYDFMTLSLNLTRKPTRMLAMRVIRSEISNPATAAVVAMQTNITIESMEN